VVRKDCGTLILSPLPIKRKPPIPVGVITEYGGLSCEKGATTIYTGSAVHALRAIRKHGGYAHAIKGQGKTRWLSFHYQGMDVYPVSSWLSLREVVDFRDYCHSYGIGAKSLQAMGFYLLRYSLAGSLDLDEGRDIPFEHFPAGAFTYSQEGVFDNVYQSDIRAAYTSALAAMRPARTYVPTRRIHATEVSQHDGSFALVGFRVTSRHSDFGILPSLDTEGATTFGAKGWRRSILSANDIRLALSVGIPVTVEKAWIPSHFPALPFQPFLSLVRDAREKCGRAAKIATNSVWGVFTAGAQVRRYEFQNRRIRYRDLPSRAKICQPLAFSVVAHLRERIIMEGFGTGCVQAHTDGVLASYPVETGTEIGDWQVRGQYDKAVVVRPTCYSVTRNGETTYKVSGAMANRRDFRERLNQWT